MELNKLHEFKVLMWILIQNQIAKWSMQSWGLLSKHIWIQISQKFDSFYSVS